MYTPKHFCQSEPAILHEVVRENGFATLITPTGDAADPLAITHLPLLLEGKDRLIGHMARPNPHWKLFAETRAPSTAIFHGPHGYVSPDWYGEPEANYVPTWNYVTVHASGHPKLIEDGEQLRNILDRLTSQYESGRDRPWSTKAMSEKALAGMARGIVGFEMPVDCWQGKFKISQNKSGPAKQSLMKITENSPHPDDRALARWMERLEAG